MCIGNENIEHIKKIYNKNNNIIFIDEDNNIIKTSYTNIFNNSRHIVYGNRLVYYPVNKSLIELNNYVKIGNTHYCKWGVDTDYLQVKKKDVKKINIMIDHFGPNDGIRSVDGKYPDKTKVILNRMVKYKKNRDNIKLMMYDNSRYGTFEDNNLNKNSYLNDVEIINEIFYKDNLNLALNCDIFIVTHHEHFGLDICLYSMAGNLILSSQENVYAVLKKNNILHKIINFDTITDEELDEIILNIDKKSNFDKVKNNTYENTIGKCLKDILQ